ncbi:MAG: FAD-binding oxidoreductase, partial [Planctomycetales bacterium]|nr:FAD-binding oxidoreductase [Planctomycetales bacterium]
MSDQFTIETPEQLTELLQTAAAQQTPVYPVGGATSLDFGLPAKQPGWNVDLTGLNRVIDYPAADMTITVQAGMRIKDLQQTLAANQQQLPLDVPQADRATVGGVLATNFSGHRRFGYGTARDYVIGIRAIDGRGEAFAGGGRVVKNVAGYDFCKLLIGSLGTLGIITEVTFKLRPLPNHTEALIVAPQNLAQLDELLERLGQSVAQPIAVEWLVGPQWQSLA